MMDAVTLHKLLNGDVLYLDGYLVKVGGSFYYTEDKEEIEKFLCELNPRDTTTIKLYKITVLLHDVIKVGRGEDGIPENP